MAYISAEEVKQIRQAVKKALPAFKVSVTRDHHSGVIVALQAGPVDFGTAYTQINTYHFTSHYADRPAALDVLQTVQACIFGIKSPEYHETGDYGTQPDFYHYIHVGKWDVPYVCTAVPAQIAA